MGDRHCPLLHSYQHLKFHINGKGILQSTLLSIQNRVTDDVNEFRMVPLESVEQPSLVLRLDQHTRSTVHTLLDSPDFG
jgi:hypothetical protein